MTVLVTAPSGTIDHWRDFHVRVALAEPNEICGSKSGYGRSPLADLIAQLDGITAVVVQRYRVTVYKGDAFTWDEIVPQVTEILRCFTAPSENPTKGE